jgi:hypothetical protein
MIPHLWSTDDKSLRIFFKKSRPFRPVTDNIHFIFLPIVESYFL